MKILEPGHVYQLDNIDGEAQNTLTFVLRSHPPEKYPGNAGAHPGCIMQEVLRALIDRTKYVNSQFPCTETGIALLMLRSAMFQFEARAARLHGDLAEFQSTVSVEDIETHPACPLCGHIGHPSRLNDKAWHEKQQSKMPRA